MTALPPLTLSGGGLILRAFCEQDAPLIVEAGRDPLIPLITTVTPNGTEADAHAFIARQEERRTSGVGYSLAIGNVESNRAVGQVGLWFRQRDEGRLSLGYWVVLSGRGRGYAARALRELSRYGLTLPDIVRLELHVEPWNEASWRSAERVGFRREGLLRRWQRIGGEWRDLYGYALLAGELRE